MRSSDFVEGITEQVQHYWDTYAARLEVPGKAWGSEEFFAEIKSEHDKVYSPANRILNLASLRGKSLLELGCGIGLDTVQFARHGAKVTAIDLSPVSIDLAKRLLAQRSLQAELEMASVEELPYPSNTFDVVVGRGILMYISNDSRTVDEMFRVLKAGGEANISLHNRFSWYVLLAKISGTNLYHEAGDPPVNKLYSVWQARKIFAKFSSVEIRFDRFPSETTKRTGIFAKLYNHVFVPFTRILPAAIVKPFGFYMIIKAIK